MKQLITNESPQSLIDAYLNNAIFHAVVTKHEVNDSDYASMLEEAVSLLSQEISNKNNMLLKYARKHGPLEII